MRKTRVKGGDQHAMSVRIDNELWEWLQNEPNKNRLINECIHFIKCMESGKQGDTKTLKGHLYKRLDEDLITYRQEKIMRTVE